MIDSDRRNYYQSNLLRVYSTVVIAVVDNLVSSLNNDEYALDSIITH